MGIPEAWLSECLGACLTGWSFAHVTGSSHCAFIQPTEIGQLQIPTHSTTTE